MTAPPELSVPTGWGVTRLDRVATVNARIGWKALTADEYVDDGFIFLATPNIKGHDIDYDSVNYITDYRYRESPDLQLRRGDVLLAKDGSTLGICNIVNRLPRPATVNGSVAVLRPHGINGAFLRFFLESAFIQERIQTVKDGMGVPHLFQWDIKRFPLLLPPASDQARIAEYLDDRVRRIDDIVRLRKEQIDSLELRRRMGLLAVLEGMPCHTPTGVPWMPHGEKDWLVRPLKAVSRCLDRYRVPLSSEERGPMQGNYPYYGASAAVDYIDRYLFDQELVLFGEDGAALENPKSDVVQRVSGKCWVNNHTHILASNGHADLDYLAAYLRVVDRQAVLSGSTRPKVTQEDLMNLRVVLPPLGAQRDLASRVTDRRNETTRLLDEMQAQVHLLQERKRSLITAAVSGEFDVAAASGRAI